MKVIHLTLAAGGGAGRACMRLDRALREAGVDSTVVTAASPAAAALVAAWRRFAIHLDRAPLLRYRRKSVFAWWSNNRVGWFPARAIAAQGADIVHLHWVGDGMISARHMAAFGPRVVWTLHDMWPFTGGCHYADGCRRYETGCGECPQLGSRHGRDLSRCNVEERLDAWAHHPWVAVCPSRWMADCARRSRLLGLRRIECIPNTVPPDVFRRLDTVRARGRFGFGPGDLVIVAGAAGDTADRRKGLPILWATARDLGRRFSDRVVRLVLFGHGQAEVRRSEGIVIQAIGPIGAEEDLACLFSAADVVVVPSLQDNLPNVAVEAVACGTPVAGFDSGGLSEIVAEPACGAVAAEFTGDALVAAIAGAVEFRQRSPWAVDECRRIALGTYGPARIAELHGRLYSELLERRSGDVERASSAPD